MIDRLPPDKADAALDDLLRQAHWPDLSPEAIDRLHARLDEPQADSAIRGPGRDAHTRRTIFALAAAAMVAGGLGLWAFWPQEHESPAPRVAQVDPVDRVIDTDGLAPAAPPSQQGDRLPGRAPTPLEMAWVRIQTRHARERAQPTSQPAPAEPRDVKTPAELMEEAVTALASAEESEQAVQAVARGLADLDSRTRDELLLSTALDESAPENEQQAALTLLERLAEPATLWRLVLEAERYDAAADRWELRPAVVEVLARRIPAEALTRAIEQGESAGRERALLGALAVSHDPAAPQALLEVGEMLPQQARQAIADAPRGAPAVRRLVSALDDPRIARREAAAWLLSASSDPWIYQSAVQRLADPSRRREALLVLMQSPSPAAQRLLGEVTRQSGVEAGMLSLRAQGIPPLAPGDEDEKDHLILNNFF